ncbi:MAG: hypothetical protein CH6_1047 [Candidatus Kapaibacterium sp.]|nr:MAG: hypothetical protein CH6_1047 [Candidatus Kapabacteria bacterium]
MVVATGKSRLEPTYKELKHDINASFYDRFLGLEPTYKELKLKYGSPSIRLPAGLEPTYKELKLSHFKG